MRDRDKGKFVATVGTDSYFIRRQSSRFKMNGVELLKCSSRGPIHVVKYSQDIEKPQHQVHRKFRGLTDAHRWVTYYVPV